MRKCESPDSLPPEAVERLKREEEDRADALAQIARKEAENARNHRVGCGLIAFAVVVVLIPLWQTNDVPMIPALLAGGALVGAWNLIDPDRFNPLTKQGLDKLPGRKGGSE